MSSIGTMTGFPHFDFVVASDQALAVLDDRDVETGAADVGMDDVGAIALQLGQIGRVSTPPAGPDYELLGMQLA